MKKNLNQIDRLTRILVALIVGVLYVFGVINGLLATVLIGAAVVWVLTSCFSYCPMYRVLGLSTIKEPVDQSDLSN
jgi:hypothetical protein